MESCGLKPCELEPEVSGVSSGQKGFVSLLRRCHVFSGARAYDSTGVKLTILCEVGKACHKGDIQSSGGDSKRCPFKEFKMISYEDYLLCEEHRGPHCCYGSPDWNFKRFTPVLSIIRKGAPDRRQRRPVDRSVRCNKF
eukprot:968951-Prorocentrum_minimum.AAC.3